MENGVFRFSLSYMIYSEAFDQLTEPWRVAAVERLRSILNGQFFEPKHRHLTPAILCDLLSILTATKPDLLATAKR